MGASRKQLTHQQLVQLADLLRRHCNASNGIAVYHEGWSDEKIVEAMGRVCNLSSVVNLRRTLIGEVRKPRSRPKPDELLQRIEALEQWAARRPVEPFVHQPDDLFESRRERVASALRQ